MTGGEDVCAAAFGGMIAGRGAHQINANLLGKMFPEQCGSGCGRGNGPFNRIDQFADISRPMIREQGFDEIGGKCFGIQAASFADLFRMVVGDRDNVLPALSQGRQGNRMGAEPV